MNVKGEGGLARFDHDQHAAHRLRADQRADLTKLGAELLAVAEIIEIEVVDVDDRLGIFAHHPTLPSRLIPISFCASTANSIGNCWMTSRTNPLTIKATAASSSRPRLLA